MTNIGKPAGGILGAIALLVLAGCGAEAPAPAPVVKASAPETTLPRVGETTPLAVVPGIAAVNPDSRVAVSSTFPGVLVRISVVEGQQVRARQALGVVSSRDALQTASAGTGADARVALARAQARRLTELAKAGVVADARADEARANLAVAEAEARHARTALRQGGAGADGSVTLRSPISGRVAHVGATAGDPLDGAAAPFIIERGSAQALELRLPARLAGLVHEGMAVELPGGVRGRIVAVSPGLDPATRAILARASVPAGAGLVSGTEISVTLLAAPADGILSIPAAALTSLEGRDVVFVATSDGFAARKVVVGARTTDHASVLSGLKPDERVAISQLPRLRSLAGN